MKKYLLTLLFISLPLSAFALSLPLNQGGTGLATSTVGDILVGTTSNSSYSRLKIGSNGTCLTSNGSIASWGSCASGSLSGVGSPNTLTYWTGASTVSATGSPTIGYITATSTTASSTFANGINLTKGCFAVNNVCVGGSSGSGTVTSVDMSVPIGLSVSGNPITTSGTFVVTLASGYNIPLTASTTQWNTLYNASSTYYLASNPSAYLSSITADSPLSGSGTSASHLTINTSGTWSGNAVTASALAANGTNCSAGNYPLGVDASGNVENCTLANTGTVTSVTGSGEITSSGGNTPAISFSGISTSSALTASGVLYATDSIRKVATVATSTLTASSPLTGSFTQIGSGGSVGCTTASNGVAGCLNSSDWATFNGKQSAFSGQSPNTFAYWSNATTLGSTSSPAVGYITATSTTIASTFPYASTTDISIGGVTAQAYAYRSFTLATTTAWIGTSTSRLLEIGQGEMWDAARCATDVGTTTVNVNVNGTNYYLMASTTIGLQPFSHIITSGATTTVSAGNPVGSPTQVVCTVKTHNENILW